MIETRGYTLEEISIAFDGPSSSSDSGYTGGVLEGVEAGQVGGDYEGGKS
jgi:hypothetical protein